MQCLTSAGWPPGASSIPPAPPNELDSYQVRITAITHAPRAGKINYRINAVDLYAMVLRVTESWLSVPPALQAAAHNNPRSPQGIREHRAALMEAVQSFTHHAELVRRPAILDLVQGVVGTDHRQRADLVGTCSHP
ncbi:MULTISPECIES: hypothetical protein [Streptomyces]|uniref:HTH-type transcriptional repressor Sco4008 C-terminal domain-containing protein n=1 Tax=Streptomyces galilaeus TaxID=33899 RepID=A0ABW9IXD7_STRGJ